MKRVEAVRRVERWFAQRGWKPLQFQREVWRRHAAGESGLIHAATGTGKTYAAWFAALVEWMSDSGHELGRFSQPRGNQVVWITPLRALATDTLNSLREPLRDLGLPWTIETRTSDSSATIRKRQQSRLPTALVTTPESLTLFLTRPDAADLFGDTATVIVDEWHELMSTKRGVQTELALARLRRFRPGLRIWGLSATLGNLESAAASLVAGPAAIVAGKLSKNIVLDAVLPDRIDRFPWGGHLGIALLEKVLPAIDAAANAIVFTNTRSQTETWYQALLRARPHWAGRIALHHSSLDRSVRDWVENRLRDGGLKCVVSTSSLDLGVDFAPVELVVQIGTPKGIARVIQRAGRSGHRPGVASKLTFVPTNAWELVEIAAARAAINRCRIESRLPLVKPLDVLAQHLATVAIGGGFRAEELKAEVRTTVAYADLTDDEWEWTLDFVARGGAALHGYSDYRKLEIRDGIYRIADAKTAHRHRMNVGTIVGDAAIAVRYVTGGRLGTIEESFISRLNVGDRFVFAGKTLELVVVRELTAYVRRVKGAGIVPRWSGGRLSFSTELAEAVRERLEEAREGRFVGREMTAARPLLELQKQWSILPSRDELLVERMQSREGYHLFVHPFEGRLVHEGLAALTAFRLGKVRPLTFSIAVNDNGFELLCDQPIPLAEAIEAGLFEPRDLANDVLASLNASELARRQFREIARVAGLMPANSPGQKRTLRHLQASADLLFDVFVKYDPGNLLIQQANREVLERQLEQHRLRETLARISQCRLRVVELQRPTPLSFPLLVERLRQKLSSEKLADRIRRMTVLLEREAGIRDRANRRSPRKAARSY